MAEVVPSSVLIADDEEEIAQALGRVLGRKGLTTLLAKGGREALDLIRAAHPDVMLVDFRMPEMDGMELMRKSQELDPELPVILITAFADVRGAVEAIRAGAHDYLSKPFDHREVIRVVLSALHSRRVQPGFKRLRLDADPLREIFGPSEAIGKVISAIEQVAKLNFSVLIAGETGSGKEVVAQAIHRASSRSTGPFVAIDCGAIPEALLESELFGHERGAFTGADQQKAGKLEAARGGTLFLDEISNMALASQAKLLRVLQERTMQRLGGTKSIEVDIRVLAAGNRDIEDLCGNGTFRGDLYYRLNDFAIRIPPLRQRKADIPFLAKRFMDLTNLELGKFVKGFSKAAIGAMLAYDWPGNVRQLRSVVRRAVLTGEEIVTEEQLAFKKGIAAPLLDNEPAACSQVANEEWDGLPLREILRRNLVDLERKVIAHVLRSAGGNKAKAARLLHVDYKTLHSKVKEYGIQTEGEKLNGQETY